MNANTSKQQTTPSLTDQAEALWSTLEQATSILDMLAAKYIKTPDYPIFMTVEDELLGKAKQQLNDLMVNLPSSSNTVQHFARMVHEEATKLEALNKSILTWVETQNPNNTTAKLDINASDAYMLTVAAITTAQTMGDYADSYACRGTWEVRA